jgi:hypothetical protein
VNPVGGLRKSLLETFGGACRSRVTYCLPKQSYKLSSQLVYNNKSTFPGYFTCGLVYNLWSFGGNRLTGLNGLSVILPRVMHISTAPLFTIFLMLVKPY